MVSLSEFSDLVSKIYEAAFDFERWPLVLETVSDALGGSTHSTLTLLALADGRLGATALGRATRNGEREQRHIDLLRLLAPHLRRAAQIHLCLEKMRLGDAGGAEALDRLARGVIVADRASKPLFVSRIAAEIIAEADGLRIDSTGLCAARSVETAVIRRKIAAASDPASVHAGGGAVRVSRASIRPPLAVLIAPLKAGWFVQREPAAILLINDPERSAPVPSAYLQQIYGLTPAEAAVTVEVLRGSGLRAAAAKLGITTSTVRTHLQRVFEKTQTRRQAELVRLIAESYSGLRFDGRVDTDTGPGAGAHD
jgi:DNA-binding CsgD family transcriptional regulator